MSVFAGTGVTVLKMTDANGNVQYKEGKASTEGIVVEDERWGQSEVTFVMKASAKNPLHLEAPTVDYLLQVKVQVDGSIKVKGSHDGWRNGIPF